MVSSSLTEPSVAQARARARAVRLPLPGGVPATRAALLVRDDPHPFALVGRWAGVQAIAGSAPLRLLDSDTEDAFAALDLQPPIVGDVPAGFVGGGWFGALGYGLGRELVEPTLGAPPPTPAAEVRPTALLAFHDHVIVCDREGRWWFEALWTDARAAALEARLERLTARLTAAEALSPRALRTSPWHATPSPAGHVHAVAACRTRIAEGDLFQANLALRLRAEVEGEGADLAAGGGVAASGDSPADGGVAASGDSAADGDSAASGDSAAGGTPRGADVAADLFTRGVEALAPDRGAFVGGPWGAIASLSPELFLERRGDVVRTAPIKGTRPRPGDPAAARAEREALAASEKDRAENVMIVDLMRNDLGRVCVEGSVRVEALAEVRPHAGVWHLVSEVSGRLRPGTGDRELLGATFPPGSVTGAPKVAAMDVISALESAGRQTFCGALGFASPTAGLELSVAIRTFELTATHAFLDVGGGIVADSDPHAEAAEALAKAAPLLAAIGAEGIAPGEAAALGGAADARAVAPPLLRLGAHPVPRPDPTWGVFETILVADGVPVAAEEHLERLHRAAREVYGIALPSALEALVRHTALEQGGPCRLRVLLDADGQVGLQVAPLPAPAEVRLRATTLPGGLGDRKWRDRRLIDALEDHLEPEVPLLVDLDGFVLETTRANVFAVIDGRLVTPPLDGRILPGVTRARLPADERPLHLDELHAADGVLLTGALRGLQAATSLDGRPLRAPDDRVRTSLPQFPPLR